jgi:hypothetical protein
MIFADVPQVVIDIGAAAAAMVAVIGVLGAFSRSRFGRYLWRHLISVPVGEWQTKQIAAVVAPVQHELVKQGKALISHMDNEDDIRIADRLDRDRRQIEMDEWRTEVRGDIGDLRTDIGKTSTAIGVLHRRVDDTLIQLVEGHPPPSTAGNSPANEVPSDPSKGSTDGN